ncbi:MAG: peptide chain release factor N(5)-glutamine methyltransferase [Candidatus Omnitrophica bacterium]|nr:peptide chain release factor N(5)-glutamine methyltransferase [Candidatus Omnitrophota bacterium]
MKTVKPHTPLQYIMEKASFFGLDFKVTEDVLIPRPETEVLVYTVIDIVKGSRAKSQGLDILDLGTGCGCIAISLMVRLSSPSSLSKAAEGGRIEDLTKNLADCKIIASDISEKALDVARENAAINGVSGRIEFIKSDLFDDVAGRFDIIASNPPYIARTEFAELQKEVLMEPRIALDGGQDGLSFYRKIVRKAPEHLKPGGYLVMEIGFGQAPFIKEIIRAIKGFEVMVVKEDQYEVDRIIVARWTN